MTKGIMRLKVSQLRHDSVDSQKVQKILCCLTFGLTDDLTIDAMESQEWAAFFVVVLTADNREIRGRSTVYMTLAKTPRGKGLHTAR